MTAAEVLDRAADLIDAKGWSQAPAYLGSGRMCPADAIIEAMGGIKEGFDLTVWSEAIAAAQTLVRPAFLAVQQWNARPGRTADEATSLLRRAADSCRAGASVAS